MLRLFHFLLVLGLALGLAVAPVTAAPLEEKEVPCHQAPEKSDPGHDCCDGAAHCACAMAAALPTPGARRMEASLPVRHGRIPRLLLENLYPPALPPPRA